MTASQPRHERVDQHPEVRADQRVLVVAEVIHQVLSELCLDAHVRLSHLCDESIEIRGLRVCHLASFSPLHVDAQISLSGYL